MLRVRVRRLFSQILLLTFGDLKTIQFSISGFPIAYSEQNQNPNTHFSVKCALRLCFQNYALIILNQSGSAQNTNCFLIDKARHCNSLKAANSVHHAEPPKASCAPIPQGATSLWLQLYGLNWPKLASNYLKSLCSSSTLEMLSQQSLQAVLLP